MARIGLNGFGFVPAATGGSEIYFRILVDALQRVEADHDYLLFVRRRVRSELDVRSPRMRLVTVREPSTFANRVRYRLRRPLADLKPRWREAMNAAPLDLVHYPYISIAPSGIAGKSVITVHDVQHEFHPEFFTETELAGRRRTYGPSIESADVVIASSEFTRRTLLDTYEVDPEAVVTVHIAARPLPPSGTSGLALPERYVFYPAATWHHKNHVRLLEAFARRLRRDPDLRLVLTGLRMSGADAVEDAVARLGLRERVVHLGYVTPRELADLYAGARAMVFPSLFEGFGIPLLEAMMAGCPIVASTATSIPEVAGDAAVYFDPLDVDELEARLDELLDSPELGAQLAERGRHRVELFSPERMARETIDVYDRALEGRRLTTSAQ